MPGWRSWVLIVLLLAQAAVALYARFDDRRYFCWAPHDQRTVYRIDASIDGRALTEAELRERYRVDPAGYEFRATVHTLAHIEQVERYHGPGNDADVTVTYRVNGGPEEVWRWPTR